MMNSALIEMFHCVNAVGNFTGNGNGRRNRDGTESAEMEEFEQEWKQEQLQLRQQQVLGYFDGQSDQVLLKGLINSNDQSFGELMTMTMKPDPGLENDWSTFGMNCSISCPPTVAPDAPGEAVPACKAKDSIFQEKLISKKRKANKNQNLQVVAEEEHKDENMKECTEEGDSKETTEQKSKKRNTNSNNNNGKENSDTSKEKSKITDDKKTDYIHVRARRGQATDSHSLAERVRREKISERMKYLQDLVPGCNKITGKAGMLDEIINYVQSLQRQVEFLSMKLAAVNPRLDFNTDNVFDKEIFAASTSNFGAVGAAASSEMFSLAQRQFNSLQQVVLSSGYEMGNLNPSDMSLRRTTSAPQPIPKTHLDPSNINQVQSFPTWDSELQSLYGMELQQGRLTQFLHQPFTGFVEVGSDLKMET